MASTSSSSPTKPLVLLTGVSGFVGGHVFEALLASGYRVRGTLRSLSKAEYFNAKYPSQKDDFHFVEVPDIQAPHALDSAIKDVDYICHVASPFFTNATDPLKQLIEPAVNGTKNVLSSALRNSSPSLKRVTVLSSFAAVVDLAKNPRPGYTYTEADWDPVTPEEALRDGFWGYHASKTFAERAAWDLWREERDNSNKRQLWDLVTFCPPMIYGPPVHEVHPARGVASLNTSVQRVVNGISGKDPNFAPKVATPGLPAWVDVRNVAEALVKALALPKGVSERFVICAGVAYFEDGLEGLRARGEKGLGGEGRHCDPRDHFAIDSTKAVEALGIEYIPFEKTIEDTWERVKELGFDV